MLQKDCTITYFDAEIFYSSINKGEIEEIISDKIEEKYGETFRSRRDVPH